jgi:hypothetical protein
VVRKIKMRAVIVAACLLVLRWLSPALAQCTNNFIIGTSGGSAIVTPTDAGLTSYITEYYSYLSAKYGSGVTTKTYAVDPTGSAQANGDPNNCGVGVAGYNVNQFIADHVNVLILRVRQNDQFSPSPNCTAAQSEAALQNIYNESTAAGMTVWVETAAPNGSDPTVAQARQDITTYILANFPRTIDMTTGFVNGSGSNYTSNLTYFISSSAFQYNLAGNTLAEQRVQAALGY